jgi:hypothetical protein
LYPVADLPITLEIMVRRVPRQMFSSAAVAIIVLREST